MKIKNFIYGSIKAIALSAIIFYGGNSSAAETVNISDIPLYATTQTVPPNIMIVLDDSWSMRWEVIYNDGTDGPGARLKDPTFNLWSMYINPVADYDFTSAGTISNPGAEARTLCRGFNKMAYDPRVEYKPWKGWPMETNSTLSSTEFQNKTLDTALYYPYRPENQKGNGGCSDYCRLPCKGSGCAPGNGYVWSIQNNIVKDSSNNWSSTNQGLSNHIYYQWEDDGNDEYDAIIYPPDPASPIDHIGETFDSVDECGFIGKKKIESYWFTPKYKITYTFPTGAVNYGDPDGSGGTWNRGKRKVIDLPADRTAAATTYGLNCTNITSSNYRDIRCTNTQQNYANWFTYYRRRLFMAYGAIANIIYDTNANIGVYGIHHGQIISIGDAATETGKKNLQEKLWRTVIGFPAGTPLRTGIHKAATILKNNGCESCQHNIIIALTDGIYNGSFSSVNNKDGSEGSPFADSNSNSLADIAMYWYKQDLNLGINNGDLPPFIKRHPADTREEPTEPHIRTNIISFGLGKFDNYMNMTFPPPGGTWPSIIGSDNGKIKDMFHAALNGGGRYFSTDSPNEVIDAVDQISILINNSTASATSVAANSETLNANNRIYTANFVVDSIKGDVTSQSIALSNNQVTTTTEWSAAEKLDSLTSAQRKIYTYVGTKLFDKTNSDLISVINEDQIDYLRGDKSKEEDTESGKTGSEYPYRHRESILGPVVNSSPVYSGAANGNYHEISGFPEPQKTKYADYITDTSTLTPMVFAGANDGMLHGFNADTGEEKFAFVPNAVVNNLSEYTKKDFAYRAYVDGQITIADYTDASNEWKRVLVGGLRQGGRSYYALDVSSPDSFGTGNILWEYSNTNMGYTMGKALVIPVKKGSDLKWQVVLSNGYNSDNKQPGLFIGDVETGPSDWISTTSSDGNGLSSPAAVDIDDDGLIDYIYAGDLSGKLWRYKYSGSNWGSPQMIFDAGRPITIKPAIGKSPVNGKNGVMILFGTGRYLDETDTNTTEEETFYGIWDYNFGNNTIAKTDLVEQSISAEGVATVNGQSYKLRRTTANPVEYIDSSSGSLTNKRGWYIKLKSPGSDSNYAVAERVITNPVYKESDLYYSNGRIIFTTIIPKNNNTDICQVKSESWLMELDPATGARLGTTGSDAGTFDISGDGKVTTADLISLSNSGISLDPSDDGISISGIMPVESDGSASSSFMSEPTILKIEGSTNELKIMGGSKGDLEAVVEKNVGTFTPYRSSWRQL